MFLWQKKHNGSSRVDSGRREIIIILWQSRLWCSFERGTQWLDCKTRFFWDFLPKTFPPVEKLQRWKIRLHPDSPRVTNSCHCRTQSTDKPQQLLMLIPTEPSSIESSASLLIQKPLSAALHPQPCTPHNSAYFTFISSNYKALLTRMTDFITHYYTISVFSHPNKKKVQKKKLRKKKNTPLNNKWLNFQK